MRALPRDFTLRHLVLDLATAFEFSGGASALRSSRASARFASGILSDHSGEQFVDTAGVRSQDRDDEELETATEHDRARPLAPTTAGSTGTMDSFVEVGRTLGRGGMAEVRLGRQRKLGRAVALKTLRSERRSPEDIERLVREAKIAGRLEHPNIVPVHDLVVGDDGVPQVVLKLIDGDTWGGLMRDEDRLRIAFGVEDLLEWNLGVLMTVCRALSFAHSRGILHRDVKPANVMIGTFGEVYLVDWGVAFELKAEVDLDAAPTIMGTYAYMSPEQVEADPALLGTWTDTYLLGATLHQILTGLPPHAHKSLEVRAAEMVAGAHVPLPNDIPAELRGILERALEPDPMRRTPHPEAFRQSLASFLRHRGALRLVERGQRAAQGAASARDDAAKELALLEAELAFRAALDEWTECQDAREGLLAVADARVTHALERGDPHGAARILEAHPTLSERQRRAVDEALAKGALNEAALARIVDDSDRGRGHQLRGVLGAGFGALWVFFWSFVAFRPPAGVGPLVGFLFGVLLLGAALILSLGRSMLLTRINRTALSLVATGLFASIGWCLGASWLGLEVPQVLVGLLLVWSLAVSGMAHLIDRWGAVSAVFFGLAFLVACRWPALAPYALVSANVVLLLNQVVLNLSLRRRGFDALPAVGQRPIGGRGP
jgi:hypothetical protein